MPVSLKSKLIEPSDNSAKIKALKISWLLDIHLVIWRPPVSRVVLTLFGVSIASYLVSNESK